MFEFLASSTAVKLHGILAVVILYLTSVQFMMRYGYVEKGDFGKSNQIPNIFDVQNSHMFDRSMPESGQGNKGDSMRLDTFQGVMSPDTAQEFMIGAKSSPGNKKIGITAYDSWNLVLQTNACGGPLQNAIWYADRTNGKKGIQSDKDSMNPPTPRQNRMAARSAFFKMTRPVFNQAMGPFVWAESRRTEDSTPFPDTQGKDWYYGQGCTKSSETKGSCYHRYNVTGGILRDITERNGSPTWYGTGTTKTPQAKIKAFIEDATEDELGAYESLYMCMLYNAAPDNSADGSSGSMQAYVESKQDTSVSSRACNHGGNGADNKLWTADANGVVTYTADSDCVKGDPKDTWYFNFIANAMFMTHTSGSSEHAMRQAFVYSLVQMGDAIGEARTGASNYHIDETKYHELKNFLTMVDTFPNTVKALDGTGVSEEDIWNSIAATDAPPVVLGSGDDGQGVNGPQGLAQFKKIVPVPHSRRDKIGTFGRKGTSSGAKLDHKYWSRERSIGGVVIFSGFVALVLTASLLLLSFCVNSVWNPFSAAYKTSPDKSMVEHGPGVLLMLSWAVFLVTVFIQYWFALNLNDVYKMQVTPFQSTVNCINPKDDLGYKANDQVSDYFDRQYRLSSAIPFVMMILIATHYAMRLFSDQKDQSDITKRRDQILLVMMTAFFIIALIGNHSSREVLTGNNIMVGPGSGKTHHHNGVKNTDPLVTSMLACGSKGDAGDTRLFTTSNGCSNINAQCENSRSGNSRIDKDPDRMITSGQIAAALGLVFCVLTLLTVTGIMESIDVLKRKVDASTTYGPYIQMVMLLGLVVTSIVSYSYQHQIADTMTRQGIFYARPWKSNIENIKDNNVAVNCLFVASPFIFIGMVFTYVLTFFHYVKEEQTKGMASMAPYM